MSIYTLDACAVLAMAFQERGHELIEGLIRQAEKNEVVLIMHVVNTVEVFKTIAKEEGVNNALDYHKDLLAGPIKILESFSVSLLAQFDLVQNQYALHFADTFVAATNFAHAGTNGIIVTADKAFERIRKNQPNSILFFR
jgi:PIN domain nuclease of toxin-antitoxin system